MGLSLAPPRAPLAPPLAWLHVGDLHVFADDGFASLAVFDARVAVANAHLAAGIDFAFLTGDDANHGDADQYRRVGAWIERGVLGTRLGPNANGRTW